MDVSPAGDQPASDNAYGRKYKADIFRGGRLNPTGGEMLIASWNIEGLTDAKLLELELHGRPGYWDIMLTGDAQT
jgi:hypothetical protein